MGLDRRVGHFWSCRMTARTLESALCLIYEYASPETQAARVAYPMIEALKNTLKIRLESYRFPIACYGVTA